MLRAILSVFTRAERNFVRRWEKLRGTCSDENRSCIVDSHARKFALGVTLFLARILTIESTPLELWLASETMHDAEEIRQQLIPSPLAFLSKVF